jgi:MFS family permease
MSAGIGTSLGAFFWGHMADRIGRRPVLIVTVLIFSLASGPLALTPERGWIPNAHQLATSIACARLKTKSVLQFGTVTDDRDRA